MKIFVCKSGLLEHQLSIVEQQFSGAGEAHSGMITYSQLNEKLMVSVTDKILQQEKVVD